MKSYAKVVVAVSAACIVGLVSCAEKGTPAPAVVGRVPEAIAISEVELATTQPAFDISPAAPGQTTYGSPKQGARALMDAVRHEDRDELIKILGPNPGDLLPEGKEGLKADLDAFAQTAKSQLTVEYGPRTAKVYVGKEQWPFPIPLAQGEDKQWYFDVTAGRTTLMARRIGGNELRTIEVLRAIVEAQREYQGMAHDGNGVREYAGRVTSSKGKHDGLYWGDEGPGQSPIGPRVAMATVEEDNAVGKAKSFHGYFFRVLTEQGEHAPGGAYSYLVNKRPLAGFAVLAFPAKYNASGITTFAVSNDGRVYQKNLGVDTEKEALGITKYDPDETWTAVGE